MNTTPAHGAAPGPTDETVRASYGAAMLTQLSATLGTAHPMSADFNPDGAIGYALACLMQFADFCTARGQFVSPVRELAELAADVALGGPEPSSPEPSSPDHLIDAVHVLVQHVLADDLAMAATRARRDPETPVGASVIRLAEWLDALRASYLDDYRAHRPSRNAFAAECYTEWAQLDAEYTQDALAARDDDPYGDGDRYWPYEDEDLSGRQEPADAGAAA